MVMQIVSDVLGMPIAVPASDQAVAMGAAMFAAVVAGLYPDIPAAQAAMAAALEKEYKPDPGRSKIYDTLYKEYQALGSFVESRTK